MAAEGSFFQQIRRAGIEQAALSFIQKVTNIPLHQIRKRLNGSDEDILKWLKMQARPKPPSKGREESRVADVRADLALVPRGAMYLDVGCSEGKITSAVVAALGLGPDYAHACDIVDQPANPLWTFARTDGRALPYPDDQFGLVTMFMSAHHFEDARQTFRETRRVMKKEALLIMREHDCHGDDRALFYDLVHGIYMCVVGDELPIPQFLGSVGKLATYRSAAEWVKLVEEDGLFELVGEPRQIPDRMDSVYLTFRAV
jgi:ubiquinone/menaquinone biosynthesis C-methylase UbiE